MNTIDPDAVIDAIARLFPDGIEYDDVEAENELRSALGLDPSNTDRVLIDALRSLREDGRLRYSSVGCDTTTLSYTEQARRIIEALRSRGERLIDSDMELIANVLAGKTEKL